MKLQQTIGNLVVQIVQLREAVEQSEKARFDVYELLAQCIKSGQIPQEDVNKIMEEYEGFASWYKRKVKN